MIGGDEPFELGFGMSSALVAEIGRDELYRRHLERIIKPLEAAGHEVLFWGDQFRNDPRSVEWIPEGAVCVVWNYEAPHKGAGLFELLPESLRELLGIPADANEGFAAHARLALASGKPTWLACGTSTWNSFLGRGANAAANINDAAVVGAAGGATGFMLTDWGDNGHWQPLAVSLPSIVRAAVAAWTGRAVNEAIDIAGVVDEILEAPKGKGALIDQLGLIAESIGMLALNGSAPFYAVMSSQLPCFGELDRDATHDALALLADARSQFVKGHDAPGATRWNIAAQELDAACAATELGLRRLLGDEPTPTEYQNVIETQRAAWLRSSRPWLRCCAGLRRADSRRVGQARQAARGLRQADSETGRNWRGRNPHLESRFRRVGRLSELADPAWGFTPSAWPRQRQMSTPSCRSTSVNRFENRFANQAASIL